MSDKNNFQGKAAPADAGTSSGVPTPKPDIRRRILVAAAIIVVVIALLFIVKISYAPISSTSTSISPSTTSIPTTIVPTTYENFTSASKDVIGNLSTYAYYLINTNVFQALSFLDALNFNSSASKNVTESYTLNLVPMRLPSTPIALSVKIISLNYSREFKNSSLEMFYVTQESNSTTGYSGIALDTAFIINSKYYVCTYFVSTGNSCYQTNETQLPSPIVTIAVKNVSNEIYKGSQCTLNTGSFTFLTQNSTKFNGTFSACFSDAYQIPLYAYMNLSNKTVSMKIYLNGTTASNTTSTINIHSLPFKLYNLT
ncbi:MAG: hypothetical protein QXG73_03550 [Candidatus Micrarchaeaceae archaeon]